MSASADKSITFDIGTVLALILLMSIIKKFIWIAPIFLILIFSGYKNFDANLPEKLEWETHFKASPDLYSPYAAITATIWQYSYQASTQGNRLNIDFNFVAGVDPEKSWVKYKRIRNAEINKQLLNHEQGHVYINFLLLKEGELKIRNQNYTTSNYQRLIKSTANKVSKQFSEMQSSYDKETKHGSDLAAQRRWDNYLSEALTKYQ